MELVLDLTRKQLYDNRELEFIYTFSSWNYDQRSDKFYLGKNEEAEIERTALYDVIFDREIEKVEFKAYIVKNTESVREIVMNYKGKKAVYNFATYEKELKDLIEMHIEMYVNLDNYEDDEIIIKGVAEIYFDYSDGDYVLNTRDKKIVELSEED